MVVCVALNVRGNAVPSESCIPLGIVFDMNWPFVEGSIHMRKQGSIF